MSVMGSGILVACDTNMMCIGFSSSCMYTLTCDCWGAPRECVHGLYSYSVFDGSTSKYCKIVVQSVFRERM
jgi:hypothetical protein